MEETARLERERKESQQKYMKLKAYLLEKENNAAEEVAEIKQQLEEAKCMIEAPSPSISLHDQTIYHEPSQKLGTYCRNWEQMADNKKNYITKCSISSSSSIDSVSHPGILPGNDENIQSSIFSFSGSSSREILHSEPNELVQETQYDDMESQPSEKLLGSGSNLGTSIRFTSSTTIPFQQKNVSLSELEDGKIVWSSQSVSQSKSIKPYKNRFESISMSRCGTPVQLEATGNLAAEAKNSHKLDGMLGDKTSMHR